MPKNSRYPHQDKLALYDALIALIPGLERKGATMPYVSVNGTMSSYLDKDGMLVLRLPDGTRDGFIKKYKTKLQEAHGTVQKEFVVVPDSLLKKPKELKNFLELSVAYSQTLKLGKGKKE
jgi:hypothetical protein